MAITGDFVSYSIDHLLDDLTSCLSLLESNYVSVDVLGNHDHWLGADKIRKSLKDSNIDISNDVYTLRQGDAEIHFAGVDSVVK